MSVFGGPNAITNGLVLHLDASNPRSYPGAGTTWFDLSGNNNHGTLTNMNVPACYVKTYGGRALNFDGTNDYVNNVGRSPSTDNRAFSCWFNFSQVLSNGNYRAIYSAGATNFNSTFQVLFGTDANFGSTGFGASQWGDGVAASGFNDGVWHHGLILNIGSLWQVYVDGLLRASKSMTTTKVSYPAVIGMSDNFSAYYLGQLDDVRVYNRALSLAEIRQNYNATRGRFGL
jgi:hypothetical protein